jgi:hypothetical protein
LFSVNAKFAGYPNDRAAELYREILRRVKALPDVQSASISLARLADDQMCLVNTVGEVDGRKLAQHDSIPVAFRLLAPGYFATMKIPIVSGRDFDMREGPVGFAVLLVGMRQNLCAPTAWGSLAIRS